VRSLVVVTTLVLVALAPAASTDLGSRADGGDTSKLGKEQVRVDERGPARGKDKTCCGYPLVEEHQYALRFYWLAMQDDFHPDDTHVPIYSREGFFIGTYQEKFVRALLMEGSGLLSDGRVINYNGSCRFGVGTCYEPLDEREYPYGRGAGRRPLIPFKSVAVDPRLVPIGEPLYIPEFDGMMLPDGSIHDGCVRADDTGGGIKKRKMDFFVVTYGNFRFLLDQLQGVTWITPHIEAPRCEYLREH
jgi:hypothetical protein